MTVYFKAAQKIAYGSIAAIVSFLSSASAERVTATSTVICSTNKRLNKSAMRALKKWRYNKDSPKKDVATYFTFRLAAGC